MGIKFTPFAEFAWAMMEPEEGTYDFEWLDRAVSLAAVSYTHLDVYKRQTYAQL